MKIKSVRVAVLYSIHLLVALFLLLAVIEVGYVHSLAFVKICLGIYLLAPACLVVAIVLAVVTAPLFDLIARRDKAIAGKEALAMSILELIYELDHRRAQYGLTSSDMNFIADSIERTSNRFYSIVVGSENKASHWANLQMKRASENFLLLASNIYLSQNDTLDVVTCKLCEYFNIVASGNLHDLPRKKLGLRDGLFTRELRPNFWQRMRAYSLRAAYFVLPVIAYLVSSVVFHVHTDETIRTCAALTYIIWSGLGVLIILEQMPDEKRRTILELLRVFYKRGE